MNSKLSQALLKDYVYAEEISWDDIGKRLFLDPRNPQNVQDILLENFNKHFLPATPVLTNMNTGDLSRGIDPRGNPISCYVSERDNKIRDIAFTKFENQMLLAEGGGVGSNYDLIQEVGSPIPGKGFTNGVIPFLVMEDRMVHGTSQGGLRRGIEMAQLSVEHPEIQEFIKINDMHVGERQRKAEELFPAVLITDKFWQAKENLETIDLISRYDGSVVKTIDAYDLWMDIQKMRRETGVPFLLYEKNMNKNTSRSYAAAIAAGDISLATSNVCTEIVLNTSANSTGVCCLTSLNLRDWDNLEPILDDLVFAIFWFLDNVLETTLENIASYPRRKRMAFENVKHFIENDGSIALGTMGLADYFQSKMLPFDSLSAKIINKKIFKRIRQASDRANEMIADIKGARPFPAKYGINHRFSTTMAVAPTGSISKIMKMTSPSIEPRFSNYYVEKNERGIFTFKNEYLWHWMLDNLEEEEIAYVEDYLQLNDGSIMGISDLIIPQDIKDVFKTVGEINQQVLVLMAGDRQEDIDQGQSLNLFFSVNATKEYIDDVLRIAYENNVKCLYYNRPLSGGVATFEVTDCVGCQ